MMVPERNSYRPNWTYDLTAAVIGERSALCEKSALTHVLDSRAREPALPVRQAQGIDGCVGGRPGGGLTPPAKYLVT
jgi:hypothetical protein